MTSSSPTYVLYHCVSARSFRVLWMLEELQLPYQLVMLPFPPRVAARSYLEVNPLRVLALCPGATASEFGEVAGMQQQMEKAPLMSPTEVAQAALRAWDEKAVICVPGAANKVMVQAAQLLPRVLTRRAIAALFR